MEFEIFQWLQDDVEEFIKDKLLHDYFKEHNVPEDRRGHYYLSDESDGWRGTKNPSYGIFYFYVSNTKKWPTPDGYLSISIRDAMKRYLSDEE